MTTEHRDENRPQTEETHRLEPASTLPAGQAAIMGTMASVMPWVISLFFHAGVLVILAFITIVLLKPPASVNATTSIPLIPEILQEEPIIPEPEPGSDLDNAGQSDWPGRDDTIPMPKLGEKTEILLPGLTGLTPGDIRGVPDGGRVFDTGIYKPGPGPKPERVGSARHIVYVVDCSGSMLDTFDEVRREMLTSIGGLGLRPDDRDKQSMQTFHVIFFSSGKLRENLPRRLVDATKANKLAAEKYLETIMPENRTDPIPALNRAFEVLQAAPGAKNGKLIVLLTDGEFPDSEKVFDVINKLNSSRGVHINTVLHHHHSAEAVKSLSRIARENAGTFKFVEAE